MRVNYEEIKTITEPELGGHRPSLGALALMAKIVSTILHPLLMPTWLLMFMLFEVGVINAGFKSLLLIAVALSIFTLILPIISIYSMGRAGLIKDLSLKDKQDRVLPMFITAICFSLPQIFFFEELKMSRELVVVMYVMTLCVVSAGIISIFYKISAHCISIGGMAGYVLTLAALTHDDTLLWPSVICIALTGLVMSARMYLQAHAADQVLSGWGLGFTISSLATVYFM